MERPAGSTSYGSTALHESAREFHHCQIRPEKLHFFLHYLFPIGYGRTDCCRLLLEQGADVNSENDKGQTPLSWSAGEFQLYRIVLKKH